MVAPLGGVWSCRSVTESPAGLCRGTWGVGNSDATPASLVWPGGVGIAICVRFFLGVAQLSFGWVRDGSCCKARKIVRCSCVGLWAAR